MLQFQEATARRNDIPAAPRKDLWTQETVKTDAYIKRMGLSGTIVHYSGGGRWEEHIGAYRVHIANKDVVFFEGRQITQAEIDMADGIAQYDAKAAVVEMVAETEAIPVKGKRGQRLAARGIN